MLGVGLACGVCFADDGRIRFLTPAHRQTVVGPTTISLDVEVPDGVRITVVRVSIDGEIVRLLERPPWEIEWDAGEGSVSHLLEAVVSFSDGRQATTRIRTSELRINQVERVDLVNLYLTVRRESGSYVTNLGRESFRVLENGRAQTIDRFSTSYKPLRVALVLDTSNSMSKGSRLEKAKTSAAAFVDRLGPEDEALVVSFNDTVTLAQDVSRDREALKDAVRALEPVGGTALYDAIWKTSRRLGEFDGRRILVLLSDGRDEAADGLGPGSLHTMTEAIDQALRSEVMVFAIGIGRGLEREYALRWGNLNGLSNQNTDVTVASILARLAESTGGRWVLTSSPGRIERAFNLFSSDLEHQYSLAYTSTEDTNDGKWREIRVEIPGRDDYEVITRDGYYAPDAE